MIWTQWWYLARFLHARLCSGSVAELHIVRLCFLFHMCSITITKPSITTQNKCWPPNQSDETQIRVLVSSMSNTLVGMWACLRACAWVYLNIIPSIRCEQSLIRLGKVISERHLGRCCRWIRMWRALIAFLCVAIKSCDAGRIRTCEHN